MRCEASEATRQKTTNLQMATNRANDRRCNSLPLSRSAFSLATQRAKSSTQFGISSFRLNFPRSSSESDRALPDVAIEIIENAILNNVIIKASARIRLCFSFRLLRRALLRREARTEETNDAAEVAERAERPAQSR